MDAVVEVIAHLTTADPGAQQVNLETAMQALGRVCKPGLN